MPDRDSDNMNTVGEPCEGKPHARFDEGVWKPGMAFGTGPHSKEVRGHHSEPVATAPDSYSTTGSLLRMGSWEIAWEPIFFPRGGVVISPLARTDKISEVMSRTGWNTRNRKREWVPRIRTNSSSSRDMVLASWLRFAHAFQREPDA